MTAKKQEEEYPEAAMAIAKDTYVDDCATGIIELSPEIKAEKLAADIDHVLGKGGFVTKGFTMSGKPPLPNLSSDGISVNVLGSKWFPKEDILQIAAGPLNFSKKCRGKKEVTEDSHKIPEKLTKRICSGKAGEPFDVSGLLAPILAGIKLDIRDLIDAGCGWDDRIPDCFYSVWLKNFDLLVKIGDLQYQRAVVPLDAVSMDIELISAGDASERMTCAGCYIRFRLKNNTYSCQLILGKTKIVPEEITLPRAELVAVNLNVHILEIVRRSLRNKCIDHLLISDSEIALFSITSQTKRQKPWVRNRVIEANRFSTPADWLRLVRIRLI